MYLYFFSFSCSSLLYYQAAQLVHVIEDQLKEAVEDADQERALKDVAIATAKDKGKAAKAIEKRAQVSKKARILGEQRLTEIDVKLGGTKLKLTKAESLNLAQADEVVNLKVALETCEDKWYNEGFVDAENSVEPIVYQA